MITNDLEVTVAARAAVAGPGEDLAVRVRGARKSYDGVVQALDGVDLDVRRGEVLAVLGPNGAGKTTLVEILEGHRTADAGEVSVLGHDPAARERAFRARIGIVLQEEGIDRALTVRETLELYSAAYPSPRAAAEVLDLVGLGDRSDVRVSALSGGQRRRLDLALGIAGDPELVFLAEPTTGFNPSPLPPVRAPPVVGADLGPARPGQDDPAHDALHGRGPAPRRPRRRHRPRPR